MLHNALFPSVSPVFEAICAHLDDATLAAMCLSGSKKAAASAMREIDKRPAFALVREVLAMESNVNKHSIMVKVGRLGSMWAVRFLRARLGQDMLMTPVLLGACQEGHCDVARFAVDHGSNSYDWGLYMACVYRQMDTAELMISSGANESDDTSEILPRLAKLVKQRTSHSCGGNDSPRRA